MIGELKYTCFHVINEVQILSTRIRRNTFLTYLSYQYRSEAKKDIFKVIMTYRDWIITGDIATIVSVNGESKVKLFDDAKTYIHSVNASEGTGRIVEFVATIPNTTVNVGGEYKVCALTIKDSNLMCQTGNDSPASRPEFIDLFVQEEGATTSQAAIVSDE